MTDMHMGMANYVIVYYLISHHYCTYMYILVIIYWLGDLNFLSLHPFSFIEDTLSVKPLMLSTANMQGVFWMFWYSGLCFL